MPIVELLCQRVCIYLIWLSNNRWLGRLRLPFTLPPAEHRSSYVTISMWFLLNFMPSCLVSAVILEEETMSHTFKWPRITSARNYLTQHYTWTCKVKISHHSSWFQSISCLVRYTWCLVYVFRVTVFCIRPKLSFLELDLILSLVCFFIPSN